MPVDADLIYPHVQTTTQFTNARKFVRKILSKSEDNPCYLAAAMLIILPPHEQDLILQSIQEMPEEEFLEHCNNLRECIDSLNKNEFLCSLQKLID